MRIGKGTGIALVASGTLLVSLVVAPAAVADFKTGRYAGTTSQGTAIGFTATELAAKRFSFRVILDCEDGTMREFTGEDAKAPIGPRGGFKAEFVGDGITSVVSGRLKHRKGSGTIETAGTLPGSGECSSSVDWSARKQQPAG
jgi:hypothetical protein